MEELKLVIKERATCVKFETNQKLESFVSFPTIRRGTTKTNRIYCPAKILRQKSFPIGKMTAEIKHLVTEKNLFEFQNTSELQAIKERFIQSRS